MSRGRFDCFGKNFLIYLVLGLLKAVGCKKQTQEVRNPAPLGGQIRPYNGTMEADDGQWLSDLSCDTRWAGRGR